MPRVTLPLGVPTHFSDTTWVQWDNREGPEALGDISPFADPPGEARKLVRFRISANGDIQFQTIETPDGTSGFASTEDLNDDWEVYAQAITVQVAGLSDLVLPGPDSPTNTSSDATEPYSWRPANAAEITTWFGLYEAAGRPTVTILVSDGIFTDHAVDAGAIAWSFALAEPTVTVVRAGGTHHQVDAGGINWSFHIPPIASPEPTTPVLSPTVIGRQRVSLAGQHLILPLTQDPDQSFTVSLLGQVIRLRVRWQGSDGHWYGSLEYPVGTPVVESARLTLDAPMIIGPSELRGNIYCWRRQAAVVEDPRRRAWGVTHELRYEE